MSSILTTPTPSRIEFDFDAIDEEDSPYPEVRASVSNIDDPEMPALTIRMWFEGLYDEQVRSFFPFRYVIDYLCSAVNVSFRDPAPNVVPLVLVLMSIPSFHASYNNLPNSSPLPPSVHLPIEPTLIPLR